MNATNVGRSDRPAARTISRARGTSAAVWPFASAARTRSESDSTALTTKSAPSRRQLGDQRALRDDVLDLRGEAERDGRVLGVQRLRDAQRVLRTVEEIGIAEVDVPRARGDLRARIRQHDVRRHRIEAALVDGRDRAMAAEVLAPARRLDVAGGALLAGDREARIFPERGQRAAIRHQRGLAAGWARRDRCGGPRCQRLGEVDQLQLAVGAEHAVRLAGQERVVQRRVHPEDAEVRPRVRPPHVRGDAAAQHQRRVHRDRDRHEPRGRQARARGVVQRLDRQVERRRLETGAAQERDRRRHALRLVTGLVARDENDVARSAHGCLSIRSADLPIRRSADICAGGYFAGGAT